MMEPTDGSWFGYQRVTPEEKGRRVREVFDSVSSRYDVMNDLMSMGIHRLWKRYAVTVAGLKPGERVLDLAGGTGDMAMLYSRLAGAGSIVVCDISGPMLITGRDRLLDKGLAREIYHVQGDAENLPFADNSFDLVNIAFGLRNVTDKARALRSMYRKLRYGRPVIILEFSKVVLPLLRRAYETYSDVFIPMLGKHVAQDVESYRYLVESIRMHPDQEALKEMMEGAGFTRVKVFNLSGGIVAIHKAYKT